MKNQFADYETSKILKELGFDEKCIAIYWGKDNNFDFNHKFNNRNSDKENSEHFIPNFISAPLWQQVKEWLWEKHIHINIAYHRAELYKEKRFTICAIDANKNELATVIHHSFTSPIECEIEGIKKAVEYLKENK